MARKSDDGGTTFEAAIAALKEGAFAPLYLFYGEEDFLVDELVSQLIERASDSATRSFNLDVLSGSEHDARAVLAVASAYPMMGERRVVIVKEYEKIANKEPLLPLIERPVATTCLAFVGAKPDFRQKVNKALRAAAVSVQCKPLYDDQIAGWIGARIRKLGKRVSPEACQLMQGYVSRSLREIQNEIDKLFTYVGEKADIGVDDVTQVVGMSRSWNIYELQRAVGARDIARSLEIGQRMTEAGESSIYIILMLTKYFQKLWIYPELASRGFSRQELARALEVGDYFLPEYAAASRKFGPGEIERAFCALREADLTMKSSSQDPHTVLASLLYTILSPHAVLEPD